MLLQIKDLVSPRVIVVKNFEILESLSSLFCFDSEAQELNVLKLIFTYINRKSCSQKLKGCIVNNVSILECRMYLHQTHQTEIWFLHLCRAINLHRAQRTTFLFINTLSFMVNWSQNKINCSKLKGTKIYMYIIWNCDTLWTVIAIGYKECVLLKLKKKPKKTLDTQNWGHILWKLILLHWHGICISRHLSANGKKNLYGKC